MYVPFARRPCSVVPSDATRHADSVILTIPRQTGKQLLVNLVLVCDELYSVRDAIKPRSQHNAMGDGYLLGIRI